MALGHCEREPTIIYDRAASGQNLFDCREVAQAGVRDVLRLAFGINLARLDAAQKFLNCLRHSYLQKTKTKPRGWSDPAANKVQCGYVACCCRPATGTHSGLSEAGSSCASSPTSSSCSCSSTCSLSGQTSRRTSSAVSG